MNHPTHVVDHMRGTTPCVVVLERTNRTPKKGRGICGFCGVPVRARDGVWAKLHKLPVLVRAGHAVWVELSTRER